MKKIFLIHGANSSPRSFNYLKGKLPEAEFVPISYDVMDGFYFNLERMIEVIGKDTECELISHSMGGLFGLHLTQHCKIRKGVSIATPFSGAAIADWCRFMMPHHPLFRDVHTRSLPVRQASEIQLDIPWMQIVTTKGNVPWLGAPNDTVVTVPSMTSRKDVQYCYLDETHHEVMLSDDTVKEVDKFLFG